MDIVQKALQELGVEREFITSIKYSDHFKAYGANIRLYNNNIILKLSRSWKPISEEIRIGLAQELLVSLLKVKKHTMNMDIYNNFIKHLHIAIPKEKPDQMLLDSFNRVNERYFNGMMDIPNIVWGDYTTRKLGSYDYRNDTIVMSKVVEKNQQFLDFVMHHELLHKKHKFTSKKGRSLYHSTAFRKEEQQFDGYEEVEQELKKHLRRLHFRNMFSFW